MKEGVVMKGKNFVKGTSILMIIGGIIAAIAGVIGFIGTLTLGLAFQVTGEMTLLYVAISLVVISSIIQITAGVKGLKACKSPECASKNIVYGVLIIILTFISIVVGQLSGESFNMWALVINLIVPVLYIYGLKELEKDIADA